MGEFRRFVIGLSSLTAVVLIIASAIIGGLCGAAFSAIASGGRSENAVIGFIFGAVSGFFFAALPCTIMFTLMEIAENTRRTAELLGGTATQQPQAGQQAARPQRGFRIRPE
jgi:predicted Co/Zn/Cd cation transporter (cation efflux family)